MKAVFPKDGVWYSGKDFTPRMTAKNEVYDGYKSIVVLGVVNGVVREVVFSRTKYHGAWYSKWELGRSRLDSAPDAWMKMPDTPTTDEIVSERL